MDTLQRLIEIVKQNAPRVLIVPPDTCWVDGNRCPYGSPNGKFEDRPKFCSSCQKILLIADDLRELTDDESALDMLKDTLVDDKGVTLDSELRAAADNALENAEKEVLILAADIIEEIMPDHKIVRADDI